MGEGCRCCVKGSTSYGACVDEKGRRAIQEAAEMIKKDRMQMTSLATEFLANKAKVEKVQKGVEDMAETATRAISSTELNAQSMRQAPNHYAATCGTTAGPSRPRRAAL